VEYSRRDRLRPEPRIAHLSFTLAITLGFASLFSGTGPGHALDSSAAQRICLPAVNTHTLQIHHAPLRAESKRPSHAEIGAGATGTKPLTMMSLQSAPVLHQRRSCSPLSAHNRRYATL